MEIKVKAVDVILTPEGYSTVRFLTAIILYNIWVLLSKWVCVMCMQSGVERKRPCPSKVCWTSLWCNWDIREETDLSTRGDLQWACTFPSHLYEPHQGWPSPLVTGVYCLLLGHSLDSGFMNCDATAGLQAVLVKVIQMERRGLTLMRNRHEELLQLYHYCTHLCSVYLLSRMRCSSKICPRSSIFFRSDRRARTSAAFCRVASSCCSRVPEPSIMEDLPK